MPEELERDLFDELLKKSSDNIVANPKKDWTKTTEESQSTEVEKQDKTKPNKTEK